MRTDYIVTGLAFGDEGKGCTVDALCAHTGADLVIRYNGGAQAAHNVITPDGRHHTFSQFGSGSFIPSVQTYLSEYMLVNPSLFLIEARELMAQGVAVRDRVLVDERALLTTPYHVMLNRTRELARGVSRHGTTGLGISETVMDSLARPDAVMRAGDLLAPRDRIAYRLLATRNALQPEMERLGDQHGFEHYDVDKIVSRYMQFLEVARIVSWAQACFRMHAAKGIVYEGAQGVLLDERYGFHPHTTWSRTTPHNARSLHRTAGMPTEPVVIGVTRTYCTRHGAGPFPTETPEVSFPEVHNGDDGMAGVFRQGWLDLTLLRYAIRCAGGINGLAVHHLDYRPAYCCSSNCRLSLESLPTSERMQSALCRQAWERVQDTDLRPMSDKPDAMLADLLGVPVVIEGYGPRRDQKVAHVK